MFQWSRLRGSWMILRQTWLSWRRRAWSWRRNSAAVRKVLFVLSLFPMQAHFRHWLSFPCMDVQIKLNFDMPETVCAILKQSLRKHHLRQGVPPLGCLAVNNLHTNSHILLYLCKLLNPSAASVSVLGAEVCVLAASHGTHTFTHRQLELHVCVRVCVEGDLPAISITVSAAKWGERHRQPTGMLLLFWGSGGRGPDCFAQGQHDLGIVIYMLVDCVLSFLGATQEAWACNRLARIWHQLHTT